jgi:hypothetical protein
VFRERTGEVWVRVADRSRMRKESQWLAGLVGLAFNIMLQVVSFAEILQSASRQKRNLKPSL